MVVAHRLSSIRVCDRIVVMEKGCVCEEGTHDELMSRGGLYAGLYASQGMSLSVIGDVNGIGKSVVRESVEEEEEEKKEEESTPSKASGEEDTHYGLKTVYSFMKPYKWLFWVSLLGNIFCATYPPAYSVVVAFIHSIPFELDLEVFKRGSLTISWLMVLLAVVHFIGTITWWDGSSTVKENLVVTLRNAAYTKLLSLPCEYYDEPDHAPSSLFDRELIDRPTHHRTRYRHSKDPRLHGRGGSHLRSLLYGDCWRRSRLLAAGQLEADAHRVVWFSSALHVRVLPEQARWRRDRQDRFEPRFQVLRADGLRSQHPHRPRLRAHGTSLQQDEQGAGGYEQAVHAANSANRRRESDDIPLPHVLHDHLLRLRFSSC